MMNKYTLGTIIGTAALGLAKSKLSHGSRNVFQNIGLPIWKQFEKANKGLSNGSIQGVEVAGDSFKLATILKDGSIDSIITSPPYFQMRKYSESNQEIGQENDREEYIKTLVNLFVDLMPKLKDDGILVVNIDALSRFSAVKIMGIPYEFVNKMEEAGWTLRYDLKWIKPSFGGWRSTFSPGKNFEHIFGFIKSSSVKKGIKHYNYNQMHEKGKNQDWKLFTSTIYENGLNHRSWTNKDSERFLKRFNSKEDKILLSHLTNNAYMHGAPLNPRVAWILVQLFSKPGNVVLDPFSGSGTITKVSKLCNRKAIGFELEKVHSKLAVIGEAFTKNFDQIHKEYMRSGKDKAFGGKGVSQLTPIKPCISWKNYDANKTMWIDASYLNISGSRSKRKKYNIFNPNMYAVGPQLQQANDGLSNGTLNGVELCGDSMKLWRTLNDKSIQTIITSPPYFSMRDYSTSDLEIGNKKSHKSIKGELTGEQYVQQLVQMFLNLKDKLKDDGTIVVNIDVGAAKWTNHLEHIPGLFSTRMVETGEFLLDQWLTIHKKNYRPDITSPVRANPNTEMLLVFTKSGNVDGKKRRPSHKKWNTLWDTSGPIPLIVGKTIISERAQIKLWNYRKNSGTEVFMKRFPNQMEMLNILTSSNWNHPAPMNKELAWKLIQLFSDPGDVVLDPFSGAGNTTKAAKICGRIGVGFELNKMYSMTAVIGEEWQSAPLERLSEKYRLPNPTNPRSNNLKGLKKIPFCNPKKYDPNKTMWIDLSYLNLS